MLSTSDGEFVCGVEVYHLWDGVKGGAVLSQHILAVFTLSELHVHETLAAPGKKGETRRTYCELKKKTDKGQ